MDVRATALQVWGSTRRNPFVNQVASFPETGEIIEPSEDCRNPFVNQVASFIYQNKLKEL